MIFLFVFLFVFGLAFLMYTKHYRSKYTLTMIFGKKGCGKTTTLTKLAIQHLKKGWNVWSTENIPGCTIISGDQIGFVHIPPETLLLIDEVGMLYDNRQFKNFKPEVRDWFKLQRHYHVKVIMFSQTFDVDKKLRDLTDRMFLLVNVLGVWSYGKAIRKHIVLNDSTPEAPSNIAENLQFESLFFFWAGTRMLTYIPKWAAYFDTDAAPHLPEVE